MKRGGNIIIRKFHEFGMKEYFALNEASFI